jgi:hypothetical protein
MAIAQDYKDTIILKNAQKQKGNTHTTQLNFGVIPVAPVAAV